MGYVLDGVEGGEDMTESASMALEMVMPFLSCSFQKVPMTSTE